MSIGRASRKIRIMTHAAQERRNVRLENRRSIASAVGTVLNDHDLSIYCETYGTVPRLGFDVSSVDSLGVAIHEVVARGSEAWSPINLQAAEKRADIASGRIAPAVVAPAVVRRSSSSRSVRLNSEATVKRALIAGK